VSTADATDLRGRSVAVIFEGYEGGARWAIEHEADDLSILCLTEGEAEMIPSTLSIDICGDETSCESLVWFEPSSTSLYLHAFSRLIFAVPILQEVILLGHSVPLSIEDQLSRSGFYQTRAEEGVSTFSRRVSIKRVRRSAIAPGADAHSDAILASFASVSLSPHPVVEEPPDSD